MNLSGSIEIVDAAAPPIVFGGVFDPRSRRYLSGAKEPGTSWQVGAQQVPPVQFYLDRGTPRFVLVGAMGAGKTEILVRAAIRFATEFRNANIGIVSPTQQKLGIVWKKMERLLPRPWILETSRRPLFEPPYVLLVNGVKFQFLSAKAPSKQMGTPIHGWDWVGAFIDEEEQCSDEAIHDTLSRGRDAPDGWYPVLSTCTISDDPEFRSRYARYKTDPHVTVYPMAITANPWVDNEYIESMRRQLPEREFAQRFLALEQPPERATYPRFDRTLHIRPLPDAAIDVTRSVVGADILIGHDPGELYDVSLLLRCYEQRGRRLWYVIDEVTTRRTTSDEHAAHLAEHLASKWRAHVLRPDGRGGLMLDRTERQVAIRADPHGTSDGTPDVTVYRYFRRYHFDIRPSQYKQTSNPQQAANAGVIKRNARIECVNTLLKNAAGDTRLYLLADAQGNPVAEKLATALEMSQRDEYGKAEMQRKDEHDLSHWPTALGFAVWPYEKVRIDDPLG